MEDDESNGTDINIICPSDQQLLNRQFKKELVCPIWGCGKTMSNSSSMTMHLAQTHRHGDEATVKTYNKAFCYTKAKTVFACPVSTCARKLGSGKYFSRIGPLREHYLSTHAEKKHICRKCGAKFGNPRRIDKHVKGCGKIYKCSCGCPFKRKRAAIEHAVKLHHKLPESIRSELTIRNEEQKKEEINRQRHLKQIVDNQAGPSKQISSEKPVGIRGINGLKLIAPNNKSAKANTFVLILNGNQSKPSSIPSSNQVNNDRNNQVNNDHNLKQSNQDRPATSIANKSIENHVTSLSILRDGQVGNRSSTGDQSIASVTSGPAPSVTSTISTEVNGFVLALESMDKTSTLKQKLTTLNGTTTTMVDIAQPPRDMRTATSAEQTKAPPQLDIKKAKPPDLKGKIGNKKIEKLKRLKEAMKKFVPILKKNPSVPPQIINRPNKDTSERFTNQQRCRVVNENCIPPKKSVDTIAQQDDHNSLMSIQNCLQNAAMFMNRTLPGICSPEKVESSGLNIGYSVAGIGEESTRNETKENSVGEKKSTKCKSVAERATNSLKHTRAINSSKHRTAAKPRTNKVQPFIRYESYTEDLEPSRSVIDNKVTQPKSVTSKTTNKKDACNGKVYKNKAQKLKRNAAREQHLASKKNRENTQNGFNPKLNEFCLDGLSNEFLDFLKNSSDFPNITLPAGETSTQETQCDIASSEMTFENAYNALATYVNSDTQTKPGDCSSVLSDAFTQTNQLQGKQISANATNFKTPFSSENFVNQSPTWLNNETQTDNLNDLLADAFTQTRFSAPEHQASQTCLSNNNISDNHTQTNLSFDNFLVDLDFDDQNSLDASLIPDFADMCTQTNFDPEVKELLEMASAGCQTVISATSLGQAESSNCHTQTRLTFDDLFASAFAGEDYDRELNDIYTDNNS